MTELLDTQKIIAHTTPAHRAQLPQLLTFNELPSTNDYLLQHAAHFAHTTVACFAEQQTAGRGRLGRTWVSPYAANIYLSLLWHFRLTANQLAGLNIVVGMSIVEAIQCIMSIPDLMLKWPNDIYWHDKKLGGILIEVAGESSQISTAVIGIGINVNMPADQGRHIHKPWIDLSSITNQTISRNKLAAALLDRLLINLNSFARDGITSFLPKWPSRDYLKGKHITITNGTTTTHGVAQGIDNEGKLLLQTDTKSTIAIAAGEASVLL